MGTGAKLAWARWYGPLMAGAAALLLIAASGFAGVTFRAYQRADAFGIDKWTHDAFVRRWLETGSMYLPAQLLGPVDLTPIQHVPEQIPSVYPPTALLLFAPFAMLPAILWWAIPIGLTVWLIVRWRPAPWSWPLIAAILAYPPTVSNVWAGNTTMWVVAGIAAGLAWGWPGPLLLLKPSLAPFALAGIWRRQWWAGLTVLVGVSLVFGAEWIRYATVIRHADLPPGYSLGGLPIFLLPVVAWLGRGTAGSWRAIRVRPVDASHLAPPIPSLDGSAT